VIHAGFPLGTNLAIPEANSTGGGCRHDKDQGTETNLHPGSDADMAAVRKAVFHPVFLRQKTGP
jgi:hypothetical protein